MPGEVSIERTSPVEQRVIEIEENGGERIHRIGTRVREGRSSEPSEERRDVNRHYRRARDSEDFMNARAASR